MDKAGPFVLVVDDVEAIVDELLTLLMLQGIPAIGARTLDHAVLQLEAACTIRVIACDVCLEGESGPDIVARVAASSRLAGRSFQYLFITGDAIRAGEIPAASHVVLTKPVQPRALVDHLKGLLSQTAAATG